MATEHRADMTQRLAQEQLFRLQSKRISVQAENISDPKIKKALLDIADQYRHLADSMKRAPQI